MGRMVWNAILVLGLAPLAWPVWPVPWEGLREFAFSGLVLLCLVPMARAAWGRRGAPLSEALKRVDKHALEVTVNNASMMSSFTRVVTFSREQATILADL
ncbi:MAG: hypothetical protein PHU77_13190, partial [Simplicispira sp.]|nr:hypothetical protein [Simplicispira sp.]